MATLPPFAEADDSNVRELHPGRKPGEPTKVAFDKYPGGPRVTYYNGPHPEDPARLARAERLAGESWSVVDCCIIGDESGIVDGIVAVATHPALAVAIARAHNDSLED